MGRKRPVRLHETLMRDMEEGRPNRWPRENPLTPVAAMRERLERHTTQELRVMCMRECPAVSLVMDEGARERFVKALLIRRLGRSSTPRLKPGA